MPLYQCYLQCQGGLSKRRGLITGIVAAGTGLGTLIVPGIANWLISGYAWRTSYTIVGIIALVIIVLAPPSKKSGAGL